MAELVACSRVRYGLGIFGERETTAAECHMIHVQVDMDQPQTGSAS